MPHPPSKRPRTDPPAPDPSPEPNQLVWQPSEPQDPNSAYWIYEQQQQQHVNPQQLQPAQITAPNLESHTLRVYNQPSVSSNLGPVVETPAGKGVLIDEETAKVLGPLVEKLKGRQGVEDAARLSDGGKAEGGEGAKRKQTQACDRCRSRKRKCDSAKPVCANCARANEECTYLTESKKRGPKKGFKDKLIERMAVIETMLKSENRGVPMAVPVAPVVQPLPATFEEASMVSEAVNGMLGLSSNGSGGGVGVGASPLHPSPGGGLGMAPSWANLEAASLNSFQSLIDQSLIGIDGIEPSNPLMGLGNFNFMPNLPSANPWSWMKDYTTQTTTHLPTHSPTLSSRTAASMSPSIPPPATQPPAPPVPNYNPTTKAVMDSHSFETSSMDNLFAPFVSDYELHLIRLFFAYIHGPALALFDENTFFQKLVPVNRHPSFLLDAICAVSALFSTHPETTSRTSERASAFFLQRANAALEKLESPRKELDCLQVVQTLILTAVLLFGWDQPFAAYRSINSAISMAVRLKLGMEDPGFSVNPLSIWHTSEGTFTPAQLEERRRTWGMCVFMDTCSGALSGQPLTIEESIYTHLLFGKKNPDGRSTPEDSPIYVACLTHPPTETIFHNCLPSLKPPKASKYYTEGWAALQQLCFILRKIVRTNYMTRLQSRGMGYATFDKVGTGGGESGTEKSAGIVKTILPPVTDAKELHACLIKWYECLPSDLKLFKSLNDFRKKTDLSREFSAQMQTSSSSSQDTTAYADLCQNIRTEFDKESPLAVMIASMYLTAMATLHLPRAGVDDAQGPLHHLESGVGTDGKPNTLSAKATSMEVVVLARKAQMALMLELMPHLATTDHQQHTDLEESTEPNSVTDCSTDINFHPPQKDNKEPFSAVNPPPPFALAVSPFYSFQLFTLAAASLAVSGFATDINGELSEKKVKEGKESEAGVVGVNIPVVDRLAQVWPVATVYSNRLRRVVKAVRVKFHNASVSK
ncbi:hypothetical protein HDV05_002522 [Chytridiales sp. JEL 0842]|nr:hypothetical protein HDV05_002522 [Chytridiales sp. JEL 0842]